ncbi:SCO family protein [Cyclobacterium marinum]|uniref:Electron transport protein SCO1/SenC n=1 Tax=Cyclobacterium marinum (strain ATCC 25205 / DSM 745 / LMG 13164 / NCIMB 1802) TaxID=880070 RepID=G0IXV0_CYCMS|nr:SCO family protein [Cyclobacterium marinum]AEL23789.1 electron transport protein SCO1/SenC [Cyclobacterium marinum DSM 745]MBI0398624.1 SCO family protein [Cyclobacterium marinum]|tara:strand:- start:1002 stop:1667 length:666 start_codon:yes stop_codon:yes gene_type:complete
MLRSHYLNLIILGVLALSACQTNNNPNSLPVLGNRHVEEVVVDGETTTDTIYHKIADFRFTNQDGQQITNEDVKGKVYVADFFFTSCPTICPIMKKQMLRVYETFKDNPDFMILSHTIDPEYDTVALLKDYSLRLGIEDASTWNFLTGEQEKIFEIGQTSYLTTAMNDKNEPGGFLHSGAFVLIDREGRIRGIYDGTKETQVNVLIKDLPKLLNNNENSSK